MTARVQNSGLARITSALIALPWWLQWGTSSNAPPAATSVTTAGTTEARAQATAVQATTTLANDTCSLTATIVAAGTRSITEIGAFDAIGAGSPPVGGNMDLYTDFSALNINVGDSIQFTLNLSFS